MSRIQCQGWMWPCDNVHKQHMFCYLQAKSSLLCSLFVNKYLINTAVNHVGGWVSAKWPVSGGLWLSDVRTRCLTGSVRRYTTVTSCCNFMVVLWPSKVGCQSAVLPVCGRAGRTDARRRSAINGRTYRCAVRVCVVVFMTSVVTLYQLVSFPHI